MPVGVYDRPADVVGFTSVEVPDGDVTRLLRKGTALYRQIGQLVPGLAWQFLKGNPPGPLP